MRILLKIIFAPILAILAIVTTLCQILLRASAGILARIALIIGILGAFTLCFISSKNGALLLFGAFLISPIGVPMLAAKILGALQNLRFHIEDFVRA